MGIFSKKKTVENGENRFGVKVINYGDVVSSKSTPLLEAVYDLISKSFAKIDFFNREVKVDDEGKKTYRPLNNDSVNYVLQTRPNKYLTPFDFKYLMCYQMLKYGNAIAYINRDKYGNIVSLIPYDLGEYSMGQGFKTLEGRVVLQLRKTLNQNNPLNEEYQDEFVYYDDLLHLRLNANNLFNGDLDGLSGAESTLTKVIDKHLNQLINDLANGQPKFVIKEGKASLSSVNQTMLSNSNKKQKQKELEERYNDAKDVFVLDAGEDFQEFSGNFKTLNADQVESVKKMLYSMKGLSEKIINGEANYDQMEVFYCNHIQPIVEKFTEELNYKLLTKTAQTQGKHIDYYRNPFEYIPITKAMDSVYKAHQDLTVNEVREMIFKLPPVPDGDTVLSNLNFVSGINEVDSQKGGD